MVPSIAKQNFFGDAQAPAGILKNSKNSSTSVSGHGQSMRDKFAKAYGQLERVQNAGDVAKRLQLENKETM